MFTAPREKHLFRGRNTQQRPIKEGSYFELHYFVDPFWNLFVEHFFDF